MTDTRPPAPLPWWSSSKPPSWIEFAPFDGDMIVPLTACGDVPTPLPEKAAAAWLEVAEVVVPKAEDMERPATCG